MRVCYAALVLFCCVLAAGCRTNQHIAALQRDNRLKEDEIYRLRWQVEDCQEELERYRQAQGVESTSGAPAAETILQRLGAPAESAPSDLSVQRGEAISPHEFDVSRDVEKPVDGPMLPLPEPDDEILAPTWPGPDETEAEVDDEAPEWSPPTPHESGGGQPLETPRAGRGAAAPPAATESRRATQLRIDAHATGGYNLDGQWGDDGLRVVIELLDEDQRTIRIPAEVSIVLLDPDPSLQGDEARVARWDFTADEVAAAIRAAGGDARGIPLKVVWRDKLPRNENLHLFVRYTTADGHKLEDQLQLRIRLPGPSTSSGWKRAPQESPPPPPKEDRATNRGEETNERTRFASRSAAAPPPQAEPEPQPRLKRPQWSPNRP